MLPCSPDCNKGLTYSDMWSSILLRNVGYYSMYRPTVRNFPLIWSCVRRHKGRCCALSCPSCNSIIITVFFFNRIYRMILGYLWGNLMMAKSAETCSFYFIINKHLTWYSCVWLQHTTHISLQSFCRAGSYKLTVAYLLVWNEIPRYSQKRPPVQAICRRDASSCLEPITLDNKLI